MQTGQPIQKSKSKGARGLSWMGEHVAGTVVGFIVTAALGAGLVWITGKDKTEGQQIDQVRQEITDSGFEIRHFQKVALHAGATSYLLTVGRPGDLEPDEIRIYDAEGDAFNKAFSFDPQIKSEDSDVIVRPETFEVLAEKDIDSDGQPELIGSYSLESATAFLMMPVSIVWSSAQRQYQLQPLITEAPHPRPGIDSLARVRLEPFESAFKVTTAEGEQFEAWAGETAAPLDVPLYYAREEPLYLGASFPYPIQGNGQTAAEEKMQVAFWGLGIQPPDPSPEAARICLDNNVRLVEAEVASGEQEENTIARTWSELVRGDESARRGEATGSSTYIGFVIGGDCIHGE